VEEDTASAIKYSENFAGPRIDGRTANMVVLTSSQDLNEIAIQRRAHPQGSLNGKNKMELEAIQHSDEASERAIADDQATQLLLDNGFDIHANNFKNKDALLWAAMNGYGGW
jgi:ankyrin repeat protein